MNDIELRAADARSVLDNQVFIDAFENVREGLVQQIELCPLENFDLANQLMLSLQCLNAVRDAIQSEIDSELIQTH